VTFCGAIVAEVEAVRPAATRWSTYTNDVAYMVGHVYGPDTSGELWTAVECEFDTVHGVWRVGFAPGVPQTMAERLAALRAALAAGRRA
jgi:hypothetical protein